MLLEPGDQISAHDLRVVKIELDADVGLADLLNDVGGLLGAAEEIVWAVAQVDRLNQERDFLIRGFAGRSGEIGNKSSFRCRTLLGRDFAGEAVHGASANGDNVIERLLKLSGEFPLSPRDRGQPELPCPPRCGIE